MLTRLSLALIALLCCVLLNKTLAYADGVGLRLAPAVVEVSVGENGKSTQEILLTNTGEKTLDLSLTIKPLVGAADGTIIYPTDQTTSQAARNFINESIVVTDSTKPITSLSLLPGQEKKIQLEINIKDYKSISKYAFSVLFSTVNTIEHSNEEERLSAESTLIYDTALHVLVSGPAPADSQLAINRFTTDAYPQKSPIDFSFNLTNNGSEYSNIEGEIIIRNIFNHVVGSVIIPKQIVLAKQTISPYGQNSNKERAILRWNDPVLIGPYFATLSLTAANTDPITAETAFFVLPLIPVIIGAMLLSLITLTIIRVKKRL